MNQPDLADASSSTTSKPKKQRGIWWVIKWSSIVFFMLIILIVLLNVRLGPGKNSPLVRVSPQTTFATSPLKPNGDVDYLAYINQLHYVPPDQNAMVDLIRIMGPDPEGYMLSPEFFRLMGIAPLPGNGNYIECIDTMLDPVRKKKNISATIDDVTLDKDQIFWLVEGVPFRTGQFPVVDEWFESNEHHLMALRDAVQKPQYYGPYGGDSLSNALLTHVWPMRSLAQSLCASSMKRLGDGDVSGAIEDQLAMLRLGRLVRSKGTFIEMLVGNAIEGMGLDAIAQTIHSGKCSKEDLQHLAFELDSLPPVPLIGKQNLTSERAMGLECTIHSGRNGPAPWNSHSDYHEREYSNKKPVFPDGLIRSAVNWEVACIVLNEVYDRLESIGESGDILEQAAMLRDFDKELETIETESYDSTNMLKAMLGGRTTRGRFFGQKMVGRVLPMARQVFEGCHRTTASFAMMRTGVALELFRLEYGEYPKELKQLNPEFLAVIPLDPYSGQSFVYHPEQGDPYELYSVGPNGKDDGGVRMEGVPYRECDFVAVPKIRTIQQMLKSFEEENN